VNVVVMVQTPDGIRCSLPQLRTAAKGPCSLLLLLLLPREIQ
jgi:hypothetical protein